ncbi:hypothetical protein D3C80_1549280 [compost metagenome]
MINVDCCTAEEIQLKRFFFILHTLRQTRGIQRLFNRLSYQRSALLFNARFPHLLFNGGALLVVNVSVAFSSKDQRQD